MSSKNQNTIQHPNHDNDASVFSLYRSTFDRYHGEVTDYSDIPKNIVHTEPPKIQPRKSKFYTLLEEDQEKSAASATVQDCTKSGSGPLQNNTSQESRPGEILQEKHANVGEKEDAPYYDLSKPSIGSETSDAILKLFDQAHNSSLLIPPNTHRPSMSLPVSPGGSPKLPRSNFMRKLSSSNIVALATMGVVNTPSLLEDQTIATRQNDNQMVQKEVTPIVTSTVAPPVAEKRVDVPTVTIPEQNTIGSDLNYVASGFGNWLKRRVNVKNRDLNAFSPSSS
ncbi:hypothetical protein SNE40_012863 [Patella caerulea]|uniref:Uncharacterized protein n=1 Tax=Patella caerulea TaxID=87958 RepID=A0AAN8PK81_PATCE